MHKNAAFKIDSVANCLGGTLEVDAFFKVSYLYASVKTNKTTVRLLFGMRDVTSNSIKRE